MQKAAQDHLRGGISIGLPLAIKPTPSGLKIVDRSGIAVAWFCTDEDPRLRSSGAMLEPEDAERIAKICARALQLLSCPMG
jgi:hypothetical protein